jgi:hypothetical protein
MTQAIINKSKWFWPWQDDLEETWLEQMSLQGLHLKQAHVGAQYDFVEGVPQKYVYRMDFRDSMKQKDKEVYLQLFTESGWEYLGEMNGWQYFRRQSQPNAAQELFTDSDSKIQKYNRFLNWFGLAYPSYLVIFVALWSENTEWIMWFMVGILILISTLWLVVTVKVWQRIKQLKAL